MTWVLANLDLILGLLGDHLRQSAVAIAAGFLVSLPLGWVAWRYHLLRGWVITITGLLYTIPSLALLMILPLIAGYPATSEANLIVALTIYAVAIMVRAVTDGLDSVDPMVRDAAVAVGYSAPRRFFAIDLPLAGPVILAGLRVTAVSTISLATVGILVGVTNLGYLFTNGLQRRILAEVVAGVVAVAAVALLVDLILAWAGRMMMPWSHPAPRAARRRRARTAGATA